jgi:hypothetical protein
MPHIDTDWTSLLTLSSNILLDVTQDNSQNAFSIKMQSVYTACQNDSGSGVTKRSIERIETLLADKGPNSAFVSVARHVTEKFLATDQGRITSRVQRKIERLLDQLYTSVDYKIVDEQEVAARDEMQELLPVLVSDWEQANQCLQAVKAKYAASP